MSFRNFIFSKVFFKNLGLAVAIFVGIMLILLLYLNIYTRHGQVREVPDLTGLSLEEAHDLTEKNRFRLVVTDSVYTSLVDPGSIAEQLPQPGARVKKNRRINITLNAVNPEMAIVPNLVDMSLRQALATINTAGFKTGRLSHIPDLSVDIVLRQTHNGMEVEPEDTIPKGSVIDLTLGSGLSSKRTPVPDLTGLQAEEARDRILTSSLNPGTFVYDSTVVNNEDSLNAFVFKQVPEFKEDAMQQMGSTIYLWLTIDSMKLPVDSALLIINDTIPDTSRILFPETEIW